MSKKKTAKGKSLPKGKEGKGEVGKKEGQVGLINSPLVRGLMGMVPILILISVGLLTGLGPKQEGRELVMEAGGIPYSALAHWKLAEKAMLSGESKLAEKEYHLGVKLAESKYSPVLGVRSDLEDLIWPEQKIRREIDYWEKQTKEIKSREVYLRLGILYQELGDEGKANEEFAIAKEIDPNDESIIRVQSSVMGE